MDTVDTQVDMKHEGELFKSVAKELEVKDPPKDKVLTILDVYCTLHGYKLDGTSSHQWRLERLKTEIEKSKNDVPTSES
jgi:hypothetical protein